MKFFFLLSLILFISCSNGFKQETIIGIYISPENTYLNRIKYGKFAVEINLEIKKDSTFIYKTCSQVTNGTWSIRKNELILKCTQKKFIIDSLNYIDKYKKGTICNDEIFLFKNKIITEKVKTKKEILSVVLMKK